RSSDLSHRSVPSMPLLPQPASATSTITIPTRGIGKAIYFSSRGDRAPAHNGPVADEDFEVTDELVEALDEVIRERSVVSLYQPIFDISNPELPRDKYPIVAYEALARGPKGSPVEYPDKLFGTARAAGRLAEL